MVYSIQLLLTIQFISMQPFDSDSAHHNFGGPKAEGNASSSGGAEASKQAKTSCENAESD